jgi:hypothetical protein
MANAVFLVVFDPASGTLRRYRRKDDRKWYQSRAEYVEQAILTPWLELPMSQRVVTPSAINAFRLGVLNVL